MQLHMIFTKVIETNLSIDNENTIKDHQSRVIEVDSWEDYIQEIKDAKSVSRNSVLGNLHGNTIPSSSVVEIISLDDFHLDCDIVNRYGILSKKLAYRIK